MIKIPAKYKPIKESYKTFITGQNKILDLHDIEIDIILHFSYYPGCPEIPASRDKYGSIKSNQEIGSPAEEAELELLDCEFDIEELKDAINEAVKCSDYYEYIIKFDNRKFNIYFDKYDEYIFNTQCMYIEDEELILLDDYKKIKNKILYMNGIYHINCELMTEIDQYLEKKYKE